MQNDKIVNVYNFRSVLKIIYEKHQQEFHDLVYKSLKVDSRKEIKKFVFYPLTLTLDIEFDQEYNSKTCIEIIKTAVQNFIFTYFDEIQISIDKKQEFIDFISNGDLLFDKIIFPKAIRIML